MLRPAMATAGMHSSKGTGFDTLPKFNACNADYAAKLLAMRIGVFAGMAAMGAIIIAL